MIQRILISLTVVLLMAFSCDGPYKNGHYSGSSRAGYTSEPYYGTSKIIVEKGKIVKVDFFIRDSSKHELFDDKYEKYFVGNDEYVQQCRNDWKGVQSYPDSLIKYQSLDKVDAISGATWSYNIFVASAKKALATANKAR